MLDKTKIRATLAAMLGAQGLMYLDRAVKMAMRREERHYGRTGRSYPMNGDRECARRRRQIAAGLLTESNGLVRELLAERKAFTNSGEKR